MVKNGALPVIFKVIKKCNRSLPHLEVIKYSLSILYNVAKVTGFGSEVSPPLLHWKVGVEIFLADKLIHPFFSTIKQTKGSPYVG